MARVLFCLSVNSAALSKKTCIDVSDRPIKDLAFTSPISGASQCAPSVVFFGLSADSKTMISGINKVRTSTFFSRFWREHGNKALRAVAAKQPPQTQLTIGDVEKLVWRPASVDLASLCKSCLDGSISLKDVDKHFGYFKGDYDNLAKEITQMIPTYETKKGEFDAKIRERVTQVKQYQQLSQCITAANAVLDFSAAMGLEGDFQIVEDLKNQVCFKAAKQ